MGRSVFMFMRRSVFIWIALLAVPAAIHAEQVIEIISEDFEAGLGAWVIEQQPYTDTFPDVMGVFPAGGAGIYGPIADTYGVWGGSQCVGHSSNTSGGWDGTTDHWIQKQWQGLALGTYTVTLEYDFYVYADIAALDGGRWDVGNRVYLLTDEDYNYPCFAFDSSAAVPPGFRVDFWPGYENYATCQDTGGGVFKCIGPASGSGERSCTVTTDCQNAGATPSDWPYNGVWRRVTWQATITTTTGNIEFRLLKHEKGGGQETVAWDDVDLEIRDGSNNLVIESHDDFEGPDPLAGWTQMTSCREPISNNDVPQAFTSADPLLGFNIGNPGTQSAGYSSAMAFKDKTGYAWMKQLFPNALPAGTIASMRLEFDWYVFDGPDPYTGPDNNSPTVFPEPLGAGILGPNNLYPGTKSVGYASNLTSSDPIKGAWIQKQFPAALPAGTYDVEWKMDRYVYSQKNRTGNRIMLLTGSLYNKPWWGIDSDPASQGGKRYSYWSDSSQAQTGNWWIQWTSGQFSFATDGNIEIRLSGYDDTGGLGGQQTAAWDNMSLVFKQVGTSNVVWSTTDDFEDGLDGWTAMVELGQGGDPWWVGNRIFVLTDALYNGQDASQFPGTGFRIERWPGVEPDGASYDWTWNGRWRHVVVEQNFTTESGNIDVRLLARQKYAGLREVVAWDNVQLRFTLPCNAVRFDADGDGDVDQLDFAVLQACYTGEGDPGSQYSASACQCMNSDGATGTGEPDIDASDASAFELCASGPNIPADETCDDTGGP